MRSSNNVLFLHLSCGSLHLVPSQRPVLTQRPDRTQRPVPSQRPDRTQRPVPSQRPDRTQGPVPSQGPDRTQRPVPSQRPDRTQRPVPSQRQVLKVCPSCSDTSLPEDGCVRSNPACSCLQSANVHSSMTTYFPSCLFEAVI
uniref:IGFBP N-terminal domain-containing protein n=1 Tax=Xiphophorus maculatus TaxID=8083 RepID=A0A3B5PQK2_XIPMA